MKQKVDHILNSVAILTNPSAWRALLSWRPFSFTAFHITRQLRKETGPVRTIIDGGANIGQFARAALETFPEATIISFEPVPDVFDVLSSNLNNEDSVVLRKYALGSSNGSIKFFRNDYHQASSALELLPEATRTHEMISMNHSEIEVEVTTLDSIDSKADFEEPILIKLDLQGYELQALKGATRLLERTTFVLVEMALNKSYVGEAGAEDIGRYLNENGFAQIATLNQLTDADHNVTQVDALFKKNTTNPV